MSNKAVELFTAVPKLHNCAQAVAAGSGREDLVTEMAANGGGRAPEGYCGALFAALQLVKPENREALKSDFMTDAGALTCREIKTGTLFPCKDCVRVAAELVEKYRWTETFF